MAAPRGNNDLKLKTSNPGLRIIKTPIKPKKIANQIFLSTNSFRKIIDKATTIIGDNAATLWTSPNGKYLKEVTKNAVSKIDESDLRSWIFKFLVFQTYLFFFFLLQSKKLLKEINI